MIQAQPCTWHHFLRPRRQPRMPASLCQVDVNCLASLLASLKFQSFCCISQEFVSMLVPICNTSLTGSCFTISKRSCCGCYSIKLFPLTSLLLLARIICFMVSLDPVKHLSAEFLLHFFYRQSSKQICQQFAKNFHYFYKHKSNQKRNISIFRGTTNVISFYILHCDFNITL